MGALIDEQERERRRRERREKERREAGMIEREQWLADNPNARERPWEAEGISRATWYRRTKEGRPV
jgi:hypothetical protein